MRLSPKTTPVRWAALPLPSAGGRTAAQAPTALRSPGPPLPGHRPGRVLTGRRRRTSDSPSHRADAGTVRSGHARPEGRPAVQRPHERRGRRKRGRREWTRGLLAGIAQPADVSATARGSQGNRRGGARTAVPLGRPARLRPPRLPRPRPKVCVGGGGGGGARPDTAPACALPGPRAPAGRRLRRRRRSRKGPRDPGKAPREPALSPQRHLCGSEPQPQTCLPPAELGKTGPG